MKQAQVRKAGRAAASDSGSEAALMKAMLENAPINVMYADHDFVIRYINPASRKTLKSIEHLLPCKADEIIGKSIDLFHKDPGKVRRVLSDDKNLVGHELTFQLGPEKLRLSAHPMYNQAGGRDGQMVCWAIITEEYWLTQLHNAIHSSRMVMEFKLDGTIIDANDLFLEVMGYKRDEIAGKKYSVLVEESFGRSDAYKDFLKAFARGEFCQQECKRLSKDGKEIWLVAAYYPILDLDGKPFKIIEVASNVTAQKLLNSNYAAQIEAIGKSQAVIEFNMDGTVITANNNFLHALGYTLEEIKGKHHSMFVEEAYRRSSEYSEFWAKLNRGEYQAAEYKRIGKGGKEVWIQASYNPIMDLNGKPFKVVKYATDVTQTKLAVKAIAGYIDRIGQGEIPEKVTTDYVGDFKLIKDNLNACIDGLSALREVSAVTQRMAVNDYTKRVEGNYVGIFAELGRGVNEVQERIRHIISTTKKISEGNLEDLPAYKKIGRRSENDELVPSLTAMMVKLQALVTDAEILSKAAVEGKLSNRADASQHEGEFRKVIQGVNETLDAVVGPIQEAGSVLKKIAGGDLTAQVVGDYQGDHADIKNHINAMTEGLRASMQSIAENAQSLSSASEELTATSQQMSANAEETSAQANVVSAGAEQVNKNLQTVATGTEEMSASIKEIAKNAHESAKVATSAVKVADETNQIVSKLGDSSTEIGQVIKVITSIAQQTNLLALNATIEAARAGEAGKGFAVVANEVKELAKQTAKATEDISRKIEAIQGDTKGAVTAISQIGEVIKQVNDISNTIATAVEEQNATTNEMARNVSEAAKGSGEITTNIAGVADAAKSTTQGAEDSLKAAQALSKMSGDLQNLVSQFKIEEASTQLRAKPQASRAISAKAGV